MRLRDFAPQVFEQYGGGEFAAARELVVAALPELPNDDAEIATFWRICLDALTERTEDALGGLETAMENGWWYGPEMLGDHDLDSIRSDPRFGDILRRSTAAQTAARHAPPKPHVSNPDGKIRGTVVALHGAEGRTNHTARAWSPARNRGFRVIAVASSQRVSSLRSGWDDRGRAIADVADQSDAAIGPIVLGGRSLGAAVALHLATTGAVSTCGIILVAPTLRWDLVRPALPLPVVVLAGAKDSTRHRAAAFSMTQFLTDAGCPVSHHVVPGMGHYYPDDFATWLVISLDWITAH